MKKLKVLELPCPSTAAISDPSLRTDGLALTLSINFDDEGRERPVCLRFHKPRAFRKRSESLCTAWHVSETYDVVCEVQDSDWLRELRSDAVKEWRDNWVMRHFMIYVDSFGCLEVMAESVSLDEVVKNSGGT
jgi:hypothetical protein